MSYKILQVPDELEKMKSVFSVSDDFVRDADTARWTLTATDSGTATYNDASGGTVTLAPSDGTVADNDEVYLLSVNESFKFAQDKPLICEARIQFSEANTDDANIMFGVMNAVGANSLLDDGAGPKADYSGAVLFKVDGGSVWQAENSLSTTQKTTETETSAGGSSYQVLRIECRPLTGGSLADFVFFVDGVEVAKHKDQSIASATEMHLFIAAKNGSANNESLVVDYLWASQSR